MVGTGEYEEESSQFERPLTQMRISIQLAHINDTTKPSVKNNNNDYLNLTIFKVFDCGGRKKIKEVEAFAQLIPRIVKAVQSLTVQKHLTITPYNVSYVPLSGLNRLNCHCGVYTIKHIECHVLGLKIFLVSDDNIWGARIKIVWGLWEAANDPELIERMSKYEPNNCSKPAEYVEIDDL
ncbi:hypothetical protein Bca4012_045359 [Brassica carinata]